MGTTLFLCGDVMTGRGIDQVLAHPGDPALREPHIRDARTYVALAEEVNGPVPRPVADDYPWGAALEVMAAADVRVVNLETSVTRSDAFAAKDVTYRMHPDNIGCVAAARPDVCVLANNHVLDFGRDGLVETLATLHGAGLRTAGAGRDEAEATAPAVAPLPGRGRLLVAAVGCRSSGIPPSWAAAPGRPGVALLVEPTESAAAELAGKLRDCRQPGDLLVVSVHWGSNWGYDVPARHRAFAHRLVDDGVDVVHGHSSHHVRPVEVYRGRLILYGCGDFVDDYEGIAGYERFRDDLRVAYLPVLGSGGSLDELRLVVLHARRMTLGPAADSDVAWLAAELERVSGLPVTRCADRSLLVRP